MIEYIKKIAQELLGRFESNYTPPNGPTREEIEKGLREEIDKLDTRDFSPDCRFEFFMVRLQIRSLRSSISKMNFEYYKPIHDKLIHCLENYGGPGSHVSIQEFNFISNPELRHIIERDYQELTQVLFPDGAWKSTVVLAGSILEAILMDCLTSDENTINQAVSSSFAQSKNLKKSDLKNGKWKLHYLIEVSDELGKLPTNRKNSFDQVLREYRNFVHPNVELRKKYPINEGEAYLAIGALKSVCEFLS